jgi:DNA-binding response OmpR family regulator
MMADAMTTTSHARPARLVLVEDDPSLRNAMETALRESGYEVVAAHDGLTFDDLVSSFRPDLAVLDVRLPDGPDGFDLAESMRAVTDAPVLFVTAADSLEDRLRGFQVGADDYLVKPFALSELLARIKALLRRSGRLTSPTWQVRDVVIDEANRVVHRGGVRVDLTKTEFDLLCVLARSPGRVFSKAQLLSLVWGFDDYAPNLVEVHMSALRKKLEATGPRFIDTERGHGYVVRQ